MVNDILFSEWLNEQMQREKWSQADLARAAGLGPATIFKMLNSKSKRHDPESCLGIARALGMAPETVFRAAKLLPTEPEFPELDDLKMVVAQLSDRERQEIVAIAKVKLEFKKKGYATVK
jgi:transcriptional regulator with XRE-family HTH domain